MLASIIAQAEIKKQAETKNFSQYTSLENKDCIKQQLNAEEIEYLCPSFSDLDVSIVEYDSVVLFVTRQGKRFYLGIETPKADLGNKIEWRFNKRRKKYQDEVKLVTLIVRGGDSQTLKQSSDSFLYVVKVTPKDICLVAKVPPIVNQNKEARKIADQSSDLKCMFDQSIEGDY